jgi:hypothetical protein
VRCYICDVELTENEISLDRELKSEPCTSCQQIIYETAFSGKFKNPYEDVDEDEDLHDGFEPDEQAFADLVEEETYYEI